MLSIQPKSQHKATRSPGLPNARIEKQACDGEVFDEQNCMNGKPQKQLFAQRGGDDAGHLCYTSNSHIGLRPKKCACPQYSPLYL